MKHLFLLIAFVNLFITSIFSYPRFSSYTGEKCISCHVNPTGGGIRNIPGIQYSKEKLFLKPLSKVNQETDFDSKISKSIQLGADMRLLFMNHRTGDGSPDKNSFFQMQGDLYVNAQLNKYINLVISPGLYYPSNEYGYSLPVKNEIYGMISNLPAGLYLKVGRFIPNFGLKIPEHRAYTRLYNDLYTPYASDAGIEIGFSPSLFTLTIGFSNGSSLNIDNEANNSFDFDNQKQIVLSGDVRWAEKRKRITAGIGASFLSNPFKYDPSNNVNALRQIFGGFVSLGLFQKISMLAEFDYNRLKINRTANSLKDIKTIFYEAAVILTQGLELKMQIENYDPDVGVKESVSRQRRYSFGFSIFPLTGLEVESTYRIVNEPDLSTQIKNNEFHTIFKFYF